MRTERKTRRFSSRSAERERGREGLTRVGDTGSEELRHSTQKEEVEVGEGRSPSGSLRKPNRAASEDDVLELLEQGELEDGVANKHQCGSETVKEGPEAIGAEDVQDRLQNAELLLYDGLVGGGGEGRVGLDGRAHSLASVDDPDGVRED